MRGNRFPLPQSPEERAEFVAARFEACGEIAPCIRQLRRDFRELEPGKTIMDCRTWTEFCKRVLKRSARAIRYRMAGGNPRSKRNPSKEKFDWQSEWGAAGMPEFEQDDNRPFKSLMVHFGNQEEVERFAAVVGQKITLKTRYIWYPALVKNCYADKRYVEATSNTEGKLISWRKL
jgi:hypothetical protein